MRAKTSFRAGIQIDHPDHGPCTITFVGDDYVGVRLTSGGNVLLRKSSLAPSRPETEAKSDKPPGLPVPWPDCTFTWEPDDQTHNCGAHWKPFYENTASLFEELPRILAHSIPISTYGDTYPGPYEIPSEWAQGAHLCWPIPRRGLVITLLNSEEGSELINLFPFLSDGREALIEIQEVFVWSSGVEAQIKGVWGKTPVTFYDSAFLNNRSWYKAGASYYFVLSAIAYEAKPAELEELPVTPHPDIIAWQQAMAEKEVRQWPAMDTVRLEGAAIFMRISEWDRDDYEFRGPIRRVEPFDDLLGQPGWEARITVMRFAEKDVDLDVFITRRAWASDEPPEVGQDIEGALWLQGRLWRTV